MAFVSVTRLRIRSWRFMPGFMLHALRSQRQSQRAAGYRGGSLLADRKRTFWTITLWDDAAAMRAFMLGGAHRLAMPKLIGWCDEASVVHWSASDELLPEWGEADRRMRVEGRPSKVRWPSVAHTALAYDPPRLGRAVGLPPLPSGR